MTTGQLFLLGTSMLALCVWCACRRAPAEPGLEPGVLTLFAVSVKDHPTQIRMFETYADMAACEAHLQTPHFKMYKIGTQHMVKSLTLIETDPILLAAKSK